jgi:hypothetical protein
VRVPLWQRIRILPTFCLSGERNSVMFVTAHFMRCDLEAASARDGR